MLELRRKGLGSTEIARRLGMTRQQVSVKLCRLDKEFRKHPERVHFWRVFSFCTNPTRVLKFIREAGLMDRFGEEANSDDADDAPDNSIPILRSGQNTDYNHAHGQTG